MNKHEVFRILNHKLYLIQNQKEDKRYSKDELCMMLEEFKYLIYLIDEEPNVNIAALEENMPDELKNLLERITNDILGSKNDSE